MKEKSLQEEERTSGKLSGNGSEKNCIYNGKLMVQFSQYTNILFGNGVQKPNTDEDNDFFTAFARALISNVFTDSVNVLLYLWSF